MFERAVHPEDLSLNEEKTRKMCHENPEPPSFRHVGDVSARTPAGHALAK